MIVSYAVCNWFIIKANLPHLLHYKRTSVKKKTTKTNTPPQKKPNTNKHQQNKTKNNNNDHVAFPCFLIDAVQQGWIKHFHLLFPFCFFPMLLLFWTQFSLCLATAFTKGLSPPLCPSVALAGMSLLPQPDWASPPIPLFSSVQFYSFSNQLNVSDLSFSPSLTRREGSFLPIFLMTQSLIECTGVSISSA